MILMAMASQPKCNPLLAVVALLAALLAVVALLAALLPCHGADGGNIGCSDP
jgi:crotonobetainyl-CoA:carnitine CoA-transferase CaiB-like acyl-CoA transferase